VMGFKAIQDLVLGDGFDVGVLREMHKRCRGKSDIYRRRVLLHENSE